jgi:hypothetical protein
VRDNQIDFDEHKMVSGLPLGAARIPRVTEFCADEPNFGGAAFCRSVVVVVGWSFDYDRDYDNDQSSSV